MFITVSDDTYFRPAWKSRKADAAHNADAITGDIQWMLPALVHPNQNIDI